MKTNKYLIVSFLALLAAGCQDDDMGGVTAQPGDEVAFSASLGENTATRTVYGESNGSAYPIYWVSGDQVRIASPGCLEGRNQATYTVGVESETQSYASSLTKEGEAGVQWGTSDYATFYSVYPASRATFDDSDLSKVTFDMPDEQTVTYDDSEITYGMDACFMYAKSETVTRGGTVGLTYVPVSTALRFKLQGPSLSSSVTISSITFSAPSGTNIAGKFEAELGGLNATTSSSTVPTLTADGSNSNEITIYVKDSSGNNLSLNAGETAEVCFFLLLPGDGNVSVDSNWKITVNTSTGLAYTQSLGSGTLVRGQVHELGTLNELDGGYTFENNTYTVTTAEGLLAWAKAASADPTINCTLAARIDMSGYDWTPVGTSSSQYTGTFDGGGHYINYLTVDLSSTRVGLIGQLGSGGVVQNLNMDFVDMSGTSYVGGVVGHSYGTVSNCQITSGTVTGTGSFTGGIVGCNYGTMTGCKSYVSVSGSDYTGGVTGSNGGLYSSSGTTNAKVTACYWNNNCSEAYGYNKSGGEVSATQVTGTGKEYWVDAISAMNIAITTWNSENSDYQCTYRYNPDSEAQAPTLTESN